MVLFLLTTITGGLFKFFCGDSQSESGLWEIQGSTLRLASDTGSITQFLLDTNALVLTNVIGEDLPGLQAEVYSK